MVLTVVKASPVGHGHETTKSVARSGPTMCDKVEKRWESHETLAPHMGTGTNT